MNRREKLIFCMGALGIAAAAIAASTSPAREYELSIIRSTPLLFWIGISFSIITGITGAITLERGLAKTIAAGIGVVATILIASLPALRGYYFFGHADPLQHLGWTRDIRITGTLIENNPYPGIHSMAETLALMTGLPPRETLLLIVPVFYVLYALSIPLLANRFAPPELRNSPKILATGLVLAILTPPIIAVRLPNFQPIATNSGLFILPFTIYLGMKLSSELDHQRPLYLVLICSLFGLTLYHPQQALAAVLFLIIFSASSVLLPWRTWEPGSSTVLGGTLLVTVFLGYWLSTRQVLAGAVTTLITQLRADTGSLEKAPGSAFGEIGGSIVVLFTRSLSVHLVIGIITVAVGIIALSRIWAYYRDKSEGADEPPIRSGRIVRYLLGFFPILALVVIYIPTGDIPQAVRYAGILVTLGTPIAAASMARFNGHPDRRIQIALVVVLLVGACVAIPATFRSPYVYMPSQHVTETQIDAYEWTFEGSSSPVMSVNTDVERQLMALEGYREGNRRWWAGEYESGIDDPRGVGFVPQHFGNRSLTNMGNSSTWSLVSTDYGYRRNVELYNGLRFTKDDYRYLELTPGINRVYTNGGANVFNIHSNESSV